MANRGKRSNGEGQILYDKRRKNYRARVTIGWELDEENGKYKQIIKSLGTYKTKGEAANALAEYLKTPYDLENKDITFSELYELWSPTFLEEDNESYRYIIKSAYKYCSSLYDKKVRDITITDMKNCINKGKSIATRGKFKGQEILASPQTKKNMKFLFNHMFAYALESRLVNRNYAKDFALDKKVEQQMEENRKVKVPFSEEQMEKLWKSVEFVPFADIIIYGCYSGWRPSEIVELKIDNVDLENGFVKGGKKKPWAMNRLVPIHPLVRPIVEKYYNEAVKANSEYLFNDVNVATGIGLSYDQYLSRFNKVIALLSFGTEVTPHYTRHTFISKAKSREVRMDEYILKRIVGHRIKDITEYVYTHRDLEDLKYEILKITK